MVELVSFVVVCLLMAGFFVLWRSARERYRMAEEQTGFWNDALRREKVERRSERDALMQLIYLLESSMKNLQGAVFTAYAELNGLKRCQFDDACDKCEEPEGGTWAEMTYGDVAEAKSYICGKCIIEAAIKNDQIQRHGSDNGKNNKEKKGS